MSSIIIVQGTDAAYTWPIQNDDGSPFNPVGWSAKMEVRSHLGNILHTFSTELGNLTFGDGVMVASWAADETRAWNWSGGKYDLYLYSDEQALRVDTGYVSISKAVTVI